MAKSLLEEQGYPTLKEACLANSLSLDAIKNLYTGSGGQVANIVKWLVALGFTDEDKVMQVLLEASRQNGKESLTIVLGSTPKPSKTFSTLDISDQGKSSEKLRRFSLLVA